MAGLKIEACGELGPGGAYNQYNVSGFNLMNNPNFVGNPSSREIDIHFQHGNPVPNGPNGITIEVLLAICAHRLEGFQTGPFAHEKNARALDHIYGALDALKSRELSYIKPTEELAERVLDNEATRSDPQWQEHPVRFVKPEEVTVEVRVISDARQSGSALIADVISKALRENGYPNVLDMDQMKGGVPSVAYPSASQAYQWCVEGRGQEATDRIYASYKQVGVRVIRDYASMAEKTRQPDVDVSDIKKAVLLLRGHKQAWSDETLRMIDAGNGFISYQTADRMRNDLRDYLIPGAIKNTLVAAIELIRGKTILDIEETK
jgi:hypothetical protein